MSLKARILYWLATRLGTEDLQSLTVQLDFEVYDRHAKEIWKDEV